MKKNKIFRYEYIVIVLLSLYIIFLHLYYSKKQRLMSGHLQQVINKYVYLDELEKCIELEEKLTDKNLSDIMVVDKENQEGSLYNVLDDTPTKYSLVLLTSFESCSTCRDQTLKFWDAIFEENPDLSIIIFIAEDRELNKSDLRKVKAYLIAMNIKVPFFLCVDSSLLSSLGITPEQTPLSLIVNRDKKIISTNRAGESTLERVTNFSKLFRYLNAKSGEK